MLMSSANLTLAQVLRFEQQGYEVVAEADSEYVDVRKRLSKPLESIPSPSPEPTYT